MTMLIRDLSTSQNSENLQYDNVCSQVASELSSRLKNAELSGILSWRMIIDPGIGFSKKKKKSTEFGDSHRFAKHLHQEYKEKSSLVSRTRA